MKWTSLTTPNRYGECAADDALGLALAIRRYVRNRGGEIAPSLDAVRLARHILRYVQLRYRLAHYTISAVPGILYYPDGWNASDEEIWRDWINHHCTLESWHDEVIAQVFGVDVRLWESPIDGWREELIQFLPFWIQRSRAIVEAFDATPLNPADEKAGEKAEKIDPYLLEHGSSRQKKDALKHSSDVF